MRTTVSLLLASTCFQTAFAIPIPRGGSADLSGITFESNPEIGGTVLGDEIIPFEIRDSLDNIIVTGNYFTRVSRSNVTGKLIFTGQIRDLANPEGRVGWITYARMSGFGFVNVDAESRTDALGDVQATRASRTVPGDSVDFRLGPGLLNPPDESFPFFIITEADEFTDTGSVTLYASNDFGGNTFSVTLAGAFIPVKPPVSVSIGEKFFFETLDYYPIEVTGAAEGLRLEVETSTTLLPDSWTRQFGSGATAGTGPAMVFGAVEPGAERQFFRVVCELPAG